MFISRYIILSVMLMKREVLCESVQLINSNILYRGSIDKATLEFFNETLHRVGFPGRMPRVNIFQMNGYYGVEICSHIFDDAFRIWQLINKYDRGEKLPAYITN